MMRSDKRVIREREREPFKHLFFFVFQLICLVSFGIEYSLILELQNSES